MLRPTPGDPWGVEQHHWNTGAAENQQLNPGGPSNRQKESAYTEVSTSVLHTFSCRIQQKIQRFRETRKKKTVKRSFQFSWFANRTWLHYDEANDLAYCHVCMVAYRDGKLNSSNLDKAFILNGFSNWKDASMAFKNTTLPGAIVIR